MTTNLVYGNEDEDAHAHATIDYQRSDSSVSLFDSALLSESSQAFIK